MKKNIYILSLVVLLFSVQFVMGQENKEFTKANFPDKKSELKQAIKDIENADAFFNDEHPQYDKAFELYDDANDFNPDNAFVITKWEFAPLKEREIKLRLSDILRKRIR